TIVLMRPANDRPRVLRWSDSPAPPASRFRAPALWACDDRRTRPTRVPIEPWHAVSDPARIGAEGISALYRATTRAHGSTHVPDYAEWPIGTRACKTKGVRALR